MSANRTDDMGNDIFSTGGRCFNYYCTIFSYMDLVSSVHRYL